MRDFWKEQQRIDKHARWAMRAYLVLVASVVLFVLVSCEPEPAFHLEVRGDGWHIWNACELDRNRVVRSCYV